MRKENQRLRRNEELTQSSLEDNMATEAHLKASLQKAFTDVVRFICFPFMFLSNLLELQAL